MTISNQMKEWTKLYGGHWVGGSKVQRNLVSLEAPRIGWLPKTVTDT